MKRILLVWLSFFVASGLQAQQRTITGKVTDGTDGSGLPGVSILIKGAMRGTVSDSGGEYVIEASSSDVLIFSFIGYNQQEVLIGERTNIFVAMYASIQQLQEVVVIGYGERDKRDLTGAISSVTSDAISKSTSMSPELAMQGRMTGVFVATPSGSPLERPTVRIRGVSTFGFAEPLYVIDGIPIYEGAASSGSAGFQDIRGPVNILTSINPNDIESISVLKDASAAAIYGVRAANGVILITTKRGKAGRPRVELSVQRGVQNIPKRFDMLNTSDYTQLYQEAYANNPAEAGNLPTVFQSASPDFLGNSPTYDMQSALINANALVEDYSMRVTGGNESTTYFISGGYGKTESSLIQNYLERYSISSNVISKVSKYIETGLNLKLAYSKALDNSQQNLAYVATAPPWQPIYDPSDPSGFAPSITAEFEDNPDYDPSLLNPGPSRRFLGSPEFLWGPATRANTFAQQSLNETTFDFFRTIGGTYLQVEPLKGLKIRGSLSVDYYFNLRKLWSEYETYRFSQTPGNPFSGHDGTAVGSYGERQSRNYNMVKEFTISYNKALGEHSIDVIMGAMDQESVWRFTDASSGQINFRQREFRQVSNQPPFNGTFTGRVPKGLQGYFARTSYKYGDKYYLDATVRRDGASVFPAESRWGIFPSFAVGWRISSENFFQQLNASFIDDFKFRGGWGELGNMETTQGFAFLSTVSTSPDYAVGSGSGNPFGTQLVGASLPNFPNFGLSWERVATTNVGFDASFFGRRLTFTAEYYNRLTKGIIQSVSLPPNTGIQLATDINIGEVSNRGFEFQLGYNKSFGDVMVNLSGNLTTTRNRVEKLYQGNPINAAGGRVQEGFPIGYIFGYRVGGIFQNQAEIDEWLLQFSDNIGTNNPQPGDMYFLDVAGNPVPGEFFNPELDGVVNINDRTYLGKTIPGFFYGLSASAEYKGFDFSIFFQGIGDVQKYNSARAGGEGMAGVGANQWTTTKGRWTTENPSNTFPRAVRNDPNANGRFSDRFVEDASFMRLKNFQIGYTLPTALMNKTGAVERVRVFVSGTNVFTFTNWTGLDPENDFVPPTRQFMLGFNATF